MTSKKQRQKYAPEFKAETLKLAEKTSVAIAAKELGLKESQIYTWRTAAASTRLRDRAFRPAARTACP